VVFFEAGIFFFQSKLFKYLSQQ